MSLDSLLSLLLVLIDFLYFHSLLYFLPMTLKYVGLALTNCISLSLHQSSISVDQLVICT